MDLMSKNAKFLGFFLLIVSIGLGLRLYSGAHKFHFFHDGIFTLELINGPDWAKERTNEDNYNKVISGEVFLKDMEISDDEKFNYSFNSVLKYDDIHPPLYYWILHPFQSVFSDGHVSWWPGLTLNFIFYFFSSILIYKIVRLLSGEKYYSLFSVAIFAFSPAMISSDMMLRMYAVFGFFSLLFVYSTMRLIKFDRSLIDGFLVFLSCLLGALTHHFFIPFAAFYFIAFSYVFYVEKRFINYMYYLSAVIISAVMYLLIWPVGLDQVLHSKLSKSVVSLVGKMSEFNEFLVLMNYYFFSGLFYYFLLFFSFLLFVNFRNIKSKTFNFRFFRLFFSYVLAVSIIYFFVYMVQPFSMIDGSYRYFYVPNLMLICILGTVFSVLMSEFNYSFLRKFLISFVFLMTFLFGFSLNKVDYLFRDNSAGVLYDFKNKDAPVIVKLRNDWSSSIFEKEQKDWMIVNLMPYLHNKSHIYIVNDSDIGEEGIDVITEKLGLIEGDEFYVLSSDSKSFVSLLDEKFGPVLEEKRIRYNSVYKFRL